MHLVPICIIYRKGILEYGSFMLEKMKAVENRYEELNLLLADPTVLANQDRYRKLLAGARRAAAAGRGLSRVAAAGDRISANTGNCFTRPRTMNSANWSARKLLDLEKRQTAADQPAAGGAESAGSQ